MQYSNLFQIKQVINNITDSKIEKILNEPAIEIEEDIGKKKNWFGF